MKRVLTLCLIFDHEKILLGYKKRGFGAGRWNGFGGKVQPGETIPQAAIREMQEEAGITPITLIPTGELTFTFADKPDILEVHIFCVPSFTGTITETEEMRPAWFKLDAIPYADMWADDPHWLPFVLAGHTVTGTFHFQDNNVLLHHSLEKTLRPTPALGIQV